MEQQHVISGWLLRAFARGGRDPRVLAVYDKVHDTIGEVRPEEFMVELDAHSSQVERGIGRIEGPASQAARALVKRVRPLPAGLYAVMAEGSQVRDEGPDLRHMGTFENIRLMVGQMEIGAPSSTDRLALASFMGLMYQRAPKTEQSIRQWGQVFDEGVQFSLDRVMGGMSSGLGWHLEHRRERMVPLAGNVGERLANTTMWVVRAEDDEPFVLGDSPVVATISLGHDDGWRAILADESFVLATPLSPSVAIMFVPRAFMPVTNLQASQIGGAINRLSWRWAERYVVSRDAEDLEALSSTFDERERRSSVEAGIDLRKVFLDGITTASLIAMEVKWKRGWIRCRKSFGPFPFAAEDRALFAGREDHFVGDSQPRSPSVSLSRRSERAEPGSWRSSPWLPGQAAEVLDSRSAVRRK